jgi:ankyrin repeat protein
VVKRLLENGAGPHSTDNDGRTPLSWEAEGGHGAVVKLLLERGADPDSKGLLWIGTAIISCTERA